MKKNHILYVCLAVFVRAGSVTAMYGVAGAGRNPTAPADNADTSVENTDAPVEKEGNGTGSEFAGNDTTNHAGADEDVIAGGGIEIIFWPDPPQLQSDDDNDGITIIIEPKETIEVDPALAEKSGKDKEGAEKPLTGLFRTTLEVDQTEDGLVLDFSLENISGTDLEYYSGSSQKYDYIVYNSKNDEVYRWSNNMCFLSVIKETLHKKGEKLTFREIWDYTDNDGNRVPPGEYWVTVRMIAKMHGGKAADPDELTAKRYFSVD